MSHELGHRSCCSEGAAGARGQKAREGVVRMDGRGNATRNLIARHDCLDQLPAAGTKVLRHGKSGGNHSDAGMVASEADSILSLDRLGRGPVQKRCVMEARLETATQSRGDFGFSEGSHIANHARDGVQFQRTVDVGNQIQDAELRLVHHLGGKPRQGEPGAELGQLAPVRDVLFRRALRAGCWHHT